MADAIKSPLTEASEEGIAVIAAMELIEARWPVEQIARALRRPLEWVAAKIEEEIACGQTRPTQLS